jgi:glycosyltransferase involved in cell wall biosynthesis
MSLAPPLFSVVIPTYNRLALLQRALKSVVQQTIDDYEIVVVDDGSTDGTVEMLQAQYGERVRVLVNKGPRGGSAARNVGIQEAAGSWIAFLDSDDWWEPSKLELFRDAMQRSPDVGLWYSASRAIDSRGVVRREFTIGFSGDHTAHMRRLNPINALPAVVVKTEHLRAIGGFDPTLPARQDMDLYLRLCPLAKFGYIPQILTNVDVGAEGRISGSPSKRMNGWIGFFQKHKASLSWRDRLYHGKRIFYYAVVARNLPGVVRYAPSAVLHQFIKVTGIDAHA